MSSLPTSSSCIESRPSKRAFEELHRNDTFASSNAAPMDCTSDDLDQEDLSSAKMGRIPSLSSSSSVSSIASFHTVIDPVDRPHWTPLPNPRLVDFGTTPTSTEDTFDEDIDAPPASKKPRACFEIVREFPLPPRTLAGHVARPISARSSLVDVDMSSSLEHDPPSSAEGAKGTSTRSQSSLGARRRRSPPHLQIHPPAQTVESPLSTPVNQHIPTPSQPPPLLQLPPVARPASHRPLPEFSTPQIMVEGGELGPASPLPLGIYEPGTAGRERMAALMGLLPSPEPPTPRASRMAPRPPPSLLVERALDSPFQDEFPRRAAGCSMMAPVDPLQVDPLPPAPPTVSYQDGVCLRRQANGHFIVEYIGPTGELPWSG